MMKNTFYIPYTTKYCRRVNLTIRRKGNTNTLDTASKHKIADRIAREWGSINESETIFNINGYLLKEYDCSGHGGYVLISDIPLPYIEPDLAAEQYSNYENYFEGVRFYAYSFEEDCEWAKLYKIFDEKTFNVIEQKWRGKLIKEPEKSLREYAQENLTRWNRDFTFPCVIKVF